MDSGHFQAAAAGALLVLVLNKILPGGPQGVLELFCAVLVGTTVALSARHLCVVIERAIARLEHQRRPPPQPGRQNERRPAPPPTRRIDAP